MVNEIVGRLGGPVPLAARLGVSDQAVYKWLQRGWIPPRWHGPLLDIANDQGVELTFAELRRAVRCA